MLRDIGLGLIVLTMPSAGWAQGAPDGVGAGATSAPTTAPAASQPAPSLREAGELWLEGYYPRARAQYQMLADAAETAFEAEIGLARCALMTGEYEDGLAALDRVADRAADSAARHTVRGELLAALGRTDEAIDSARRALQADAQCHRARAILGELLERHGRRDEAIEVYEFFDRLLSRQMPSSAEGITEAARGFYRYSVLTKHPNLDARTVHVLQEFFQVAYERVDRNWWPARLAAADLLRAKYNLGQAAEDYRHALRINNNLPAAHVGLGRIALERWQFEEVERRVERALQTNPRYVPALNLAARNKIQQRRYDEALELCRQALEINANDIEALSVAAAACRCRHDLEGDAEYEARVRALNPRCARFYALRGDALSGLRQYAEGEEAYQQAIAYDPTDPNPRTELGLLYMQWGREKSARDALDKAWALDQYNERTFNTLDLLEKLEGFDRLSTEHFTILYDRELDWVLAPYLARIAEEVYEDVCADYDTELTERIYLEVFPTHRDFGVRITGKPWIYTVGACTGWVIALESPRTHPQTSGPYHYERVLRHEFIHTVTLALTRNRIAHWFTEGLAVYGEDSPRSFAWRQLLVETIRHDRLFTLESINWGFMRPRRPTDRTLAYAQSEWMVEYLVQRFGYDVLPKMLKAFERGLAQDVVFREVVGIETADFDVDFSAWARTQAGDWGFDLTPPANVIKLRAEAVIKPGDAAVRGRLAKAELDGGNIVGAAESAREALEQDEGEVNALTVLVTALNLMAAEAKTPADARRLVEESLPLAQKLADVDPESWIAPKTLGNAALKNKDYAGAERWFQRLQRHCPLDPVSYSGLAGVYLERGDSDQALPQLLELARMQEHDPRVPARIAAIFAVQDRLGEAAYWYRQSLYIDPFTPQTHRSLAGVLMRHGDARAAAVEYEILCRIEPDRADNYSDAAFAYRKLGEGENVRRCAARAVELDASSPARSLLEAGDDE
ncbi:MAG: tetratricopeptide repeat protein [bacterium]|nr:tetratricopeptide repeat protein [bacterium]